MVASNRIPLREGCYYPIPCKRRDCWQAWAAEFDGTPGDAPAGFLQLHIVHIHLNDKDATRHFLDIIRRLVDRHARTGVGLTWAAADLLVFAPQRAMQRHLIAEKRRDEFAAYLLEKEMENGR